MRRALAVVLLAAALPASAQVRVSSFEDACVSACATFFGGYGALGLGLFPANRGLSMTAGILHDLPVGVEASVYIPTSNPPEPFLLAALSGRFVLLREGLGEAWQERAPPPFAGLIFALRAGLGVVTTDSPLALVVGPSLELLLGGNVLVALRPTVAVVPDRDAAPGAAPLAFFPLVDFSLGFFPRGTHQ